MTRSVHYGGDLDLRWAKNRWLVLKEIRVTWMDGPKQLAAFYVAAGFETDLSSIPSIVPRWLFPKIGPHNLPSVVHDWCYEGKTGLSRAQADLLFLDGMKTKGVPKWRRQIMYRAVRAFGKGLWD